MAVYANTSGLSNVVSYEIGPDWIEIAFGGRAPNVYRYTYASAGEGNVETMKALALSGRGLNSFIGKTVKKGYASKR